MLLFNTFTRKTEEFKPIKDKQVLFYHCGPTVYWVQHIGNLRAMSWADFIRRSLQYLGYKVKFVRNYTDVGHLTSDEDTGVDKIEIGAKREGLTPKQIADKYIKIFEQDILALNIIDPDLKPRASEYISEIQKMIQTLLDKGFAYTTDLAVVYDVSKFREYNKLNNQKMEFNKKGAGKGEVEDPQKKHFADFNLWVFKKGRHINALQTWPSPWGEGFPGWHIECSVMAKVLLGETIDIHMGGIEHIPIHHTNEIAQSEAANGKKFVHYWLHNEHLNVNDSKMAKSQGTGLTLQEIINKKIDPLALRYFYLTAHYRSKQNFTWEALKSAEESLNKMRDLIRAVRSNLSHESNKSHETYLTYLQQFKEALANDFQIPQALAVLWNLLKSNLSSQEKLNLALEFDKVFGLKLSNVKEIEIPEKIKKLAEERWQAKITGDYDKADNIRKIMNSEGFGTTDTKDGYKIKKI